MMHAFMMIDCKNLSSIYYLSIVCFKQGYVIQKCN